MNDHQSQLVAPQLPADLAALREGLLTFVREVLHPAEERVAQRGDFAPGEVDELRALANAAGFPERYTVPPELGGEELSMLAQVVLEEVAGHATNGLGNILQRGRGPRTLWAVATPDQRERYVEAAFRRETNAAWAITEPDTAGSDVAGITARAEQDPDGSWRISGEKWFVTGGDRATFFLVLAWAGDEQVLFFVDRDAPGLEIVRRPRFMHDPYTSGHLELRLTECRVPEANRSPAGEAGSKLWIAVERLMIAARCCGAAERLIDEATAWAKQRMSSGRPISEYQAVQFMLADSATELLAARLMTYHAAEAVDAQIDPRIAHGKIAMAKLFASEMAGRVADRAVQIFGGRVYMDENVASRYYRELRVDRIWEGTSEIQRIIVARGLLKRGQAPYTAVSP
jgi:alkylation response protein AidB-like acyl-CoA dehydrogenase